MHAPHPASWNSHINANALPGDSKFFGNPNGPASKSQQSKLSFQTPKNSSSASNNASRKRSEIKAEAVTEEGINKSVHENSNEKEPTLENGVSAISEIHEEGQPMNDDDPQCETISFTKRSNSEIQENEDEDEDEPVRKRSRRTERDEMMNPPTEKDASTSANGDHSKMKATTSDAKKRKAEPKPSSSKAEASKKSKSVAVLVDRSQTKTSYVSEEQEAVIAGKYKKGDNKPAKESNVGADNDLVDPSEEEYTGKAHEATQSILENRSNDPYPDWKSGEPVPYAALCTTFALIEMTTKRLAIMAHCTLFLRQVLRLTPRDLLPTVQLMINKIAADYTGIELGIGEHLIMKAIGESTGRSIDVVKADNKSIGDLGLVAMKSRSTQKTLYKPKPLNVRGVLDGLMVIATTSGDGSQTLKVSGIKKLLSAADSANAGKVNKGIDIANDKGGASESKFIIRFLEGKLRLGLAERTILISLAHAMVGHEEAMKSNKPPSSDKLEKGTAILKTVYRQVTICLISVCALINVQRIAELRRCRSCNGRTRHIQSARALHVTTRHTLEAYAGKTHEGHYGSSRSV